jgi:hypothetical protein
VGSNYRGVDDHSAIVCLKLERFEDPRPVSSMRPKGKPVVHRLPWPKPLRKIPPRHARLGAKEYRINERAVANLRFGSALCWQREADHGPLGVGEAVPVHFPSL